MRVRIDQTSNVDSGRRSIRQYAALSQGYACPNYKDQNAMAATTPSIANASTLPMALAAPPVYFAGPVLVMQPPLAHAHTVPPLQIVVVTVPACELVEQTVVVIVVRAPFDFVGLLIGTRLLVG